MIPRRDFLTNSLATSLSFSLPGALVTFQPWAFAQAPEDRDHFFLHIHLSGGFDASYLFDARPLEMKAQGKMQNYLNVEPKVYRGSNDTTCLYTEIAQPLIPYLDRMSIVNGVMMSSSFDGHDQNTNMFFSGNAAGGDSFVPHLNQKTSQLARPLDGVSSGFILATVTNGGQTIPLTPSDAKNIKTFLTQKPLVDPVGSPLGQFISQRLRLRASGSGQFSRASQSYLENFLKMPSLSETLKDLTVDDSISDEQQKYITFVGDIFKKQIARSAVVSLVPIAEIGTIDAHDPGTASKLPQTLSGFAQKIARILQTLKDTPYDSKRSMFDVTTVTVASEFSRTMRQMNKPIDATGTDHNPQNNSVWIGGKGIRGGMVIGSSDFQTPSEVLSTAHMSVDKNAAKIMARPFDFANMKSRTDLPAEMKPDDYLTVGSVVNTVYSLFKVPESHYRKVSNQGANAPVLHGLLK